MEEKQFLLGHVTICTQQSVREDEPVRGTAQRCNLQVKSAMLP